MGKEFDRLIDIVATLRGPNGCPWDKEQSHETILSCLLDESYEFFEAVDLKIDDKIKEELGDLLMQVVLHAQIATDRQAFSIEDVSRDIADKLIRRHPHVFADATAADSRQVIHNWEKIKKSEKGNEDRKYMTDGIPETLPSLFKAEKIQRRVARVGFDWKDATPALDKVEEEFAEFREALASKNREEAEGELGDIIFALVNVARHHNISAEDALRKTIGKFTRRFNYIEDCYTRDNKDIHTATLEEMDVLWEKSKGIVG